MASSTELSLNTEALVEKTQKLEEFVACLEEEKLKIEAFKRELPLCMQLLTNGNFLKHTCGIIRGYRRWIS